MTAILLQNETEAYYKMRQVFFLQNATVITKCDAYYKLRQCKNNEMDVNTGA